MDLHKEGSNGTKSVTIWEIWTEGYHNVPMSVLAIWTYSRKANDIKSLCIMWVIWTYSMEVLMKSSPSV